jgi:uncharacterized protein YbaR (Trm112 family)
MKSSKKHPHQLNEGAQKKGGVNKAPSTPPPPPPKGQGGKQSESYLNKFCCHPFYDTFGKGSGNEKLTKDMVCCPFCKSDLKNPKQENVETVPAKDGYPKCGCKVRLRMTMAIVCPKCRVHTFPILDGLFNEEQKKKQES